MLINMLKQYERIWNWKKYPESVFLPTIPLAAIGLLSLLVVALIKASAGDWMYLVIYVVIVAPSLVAVYLMIRAHQAFERAWKRGEKQ